MERWNNRVAVVTGASAGIGKVITDDLLKAGLKVVALARRLERLENNRSQLPKELQERYFARKVDITNPAEVKDTFEWIEQTLGGVDILVNNAGVLKPSSLLEIDIDIIDEVIDTNIRGLIYATRAAYKCMKSRNFNGHIVHINSWVGHYVISATEIPSFNVYSPTKFAVTAINETLRNELRSLGTRIKTTSISPGGVRTELLSEELFGHIPTLLQPQDVSQAVMFALSTPEHVQIHELTLKHVGETT